MYSVVHCMALVDDALHGILHLSLWIDLHMQWTDMTLALPLRDRKVVGGYRSLLGRLKQLMPRLDCMHKGAAVDDPAEEAPASSIHTKARAGADRTGWEGCCCSCLAAASVNRRPSSRRPWARESLTPLPTASSFSTWGKGRVP